VTPRAHVLLADLDDSFLSRALAWAGGGAEETPFEIETVELEAGRARIEAGEASALLVLPAGFGDAVLREEPVALELVTNPAQRIAPAMVREGLEMLLEAVFYAHRLFGEELREIVDAAASGDGPDELQAAAIGARIDRRVRSLEGTLFPPALKVRFEEQATRDEPEGGGLGRLFLPGLLLLSLVFIGQGMSDDLWHEKAQGTLRRALASPQGLAPFLAGKLGAAAAIMAGAALIGLAVGALAMGVAWSALPGALLWCTFVGLSLLCVFLWLQLLAPSQRAASVLTTSVVFPLVMLGGSFFPFSTMPGWMATVGGWTPNGRAVQVLESLLRGELDAGALGLGLAVVALPGAVAFALALRRLRARFLSS
jgi:hypothetical protein